jgi:hypothetical protein
MRSSGFRRNRTQRGSLLLSTVLCNLDYAQSATARRIDAVRLISYFALFYRVVPA